MTEVYLGQIMMTGYGFAQRGSSQCNGQLLPINQNQALFSLLGTQFGGDGRQTFALPNMQGMTPSGAGASVDPTWQPQAYPVGLTAGTPNVTLVPGNLPPHNHNFAVSTTVATVKLPQPPGNADVYGQASAGAALVYGPSTGATVTLLNTNMATAGNSLPHNNTQPYRVINFNIALSGVFPTRN